VKFAEKYSGGCWGRPKGHNPSILVKYKFANHFCTVLTEIVKIHFGPAYPFGPKSKLAIAY